jgi:hypothetical protein
MLCGSVMRQNLRRCVSERASDQKEDPTDEFVRKKNLPRQQSQAIERQIPS